MPSLQRSPDLQRLLRQDREDLASLVLFPLKKIKKYIALSLTTRDIAELISYIDVRVENLKSILVDGESMLCFLDDFYGEDNLHILEDLLEKANCFSILSCVREWRVKSTHSSNSTLRECRFFKLWLKIKWTLEELDERRAYFIDGVEELFHVPRVGRGSSLRHLSVLFSVFIFGGSLYILMLLPESSHTQAEKIVRSPEVYSDTLKHFKINAVYLHVRENSELDYIVSKFMPRVEAKSPRLKGLPHSDLDVSIIDDVIDGDDTEEDISRIRTTEFWFKETDKLKKRRGNTTPDRIIKSPGIGDISGVPSDGSFKRLSERMPQRPYEEEMDIDIKTAPRTQTYPSSRVYMPAEEEMSSNIPQEEIPSQGYPEEMYPDRDVPVRSSSFSSRPRILQNNRQKSSLPRTKSLSEADKSKQEQQYSTLPQEYDRVERYEDRNTRNKRIFTFPSRSKVDQRDGPSSDTSRVRPQSTPPRLSEKESQEPVYSVDDKPRDFQTAIERSTQRMYGGDSRTVRRRRDDPEARYKREYSAEGPRSTSSLQEISSVSSSPQPFTIDKEPRVLAGTATRVGASPGRDNQNRRSVVHEVDNAGRDYPVARQKDVQRVYESQPDINRPKSVTRDIRDIPRPLRKHDPELIEQQVRTMSLDRRYVQPPGRQSTPVKAIQPQPQYDREQRIDGRYISSQSPRTSESSAIRRGDDERYKEKQPVRVITQTDIVSSSEPNAYTRPQVYNRPREYTTRETYMYERGPGSVERGGKRNTPDNRDTSNERKGEITSERVRERYVHPSKPQRVEDQVQRAQSTSGRVSPTSDSRRPVNEDSRGLGGFSRSRQRDEYGEDKDGYSEMGEHTLTRAPREESKKEGTEERRGFMKKFMKKSFSKGRKNKAEESTVSGGEPQRTSVSRISDRDSPQRREIHRKKEHQGTALSEREIKVPDSKQPQLKGYPDRRSSEESSVRHDTDRHEKSRAEVEEFERRKATEASSVERRKAPEVSSAPSWDEGETYRRGDSQYGRKIETRVVSEQIQRRDEPEVSSTPSLSWDEEDARRKARAQRREERQGNKSEPRIVTETVQRRTEPMVSSAPRNSWGEEGRHEEREQRQGIKTETRIVTETVQRRSEPVVSTSRASWGEEGRHRDTVMQGREDRQRVSTEPRIVTDVVQRRSDPVVSTSRTSWSEEGRHRDTVMQEREERQRVSTEPRIVTDVVQRRSEPVVSTSRASWSEEGRHRNTVMQGREERQGVRTEPRSVTETVKKRNVPEVQSRTSRNPSWGEERLRTEEVQRNKSESRLATETFQKRNVPEVQSRTSRNPSWGAGDRHVNTGVQGADENPRIKSESRVVTESFQRRNAPEVSHSSSSTRGKIGRKEIPSQRGGFTNTKEAYDFDYKTQQVAPESESSRYPTEEVQTGRARKIIREDKVPSPANQDYSVRVRNVNEVSAASPTAIRSEASKRQREPSYERNGNNEQRPSSLTQPPLVKLKKVTYTGGEPEYTSEEVRHFSGTPPPFWDDEDQMDHSENVEIKELPPRYTPVAVNRGQRVHEDPDRVAEIEINRHIHSGTPPPFWEEEESIKEDVKQAYSSTKFDRSSAYTNDPSSRSTAGQLHEARNARGTDVPRQDGEDGGSSSYHYDGPRQGGRKYAGHSNGSYTSDTKYSSRPRSFPNQEYSKEHDWSYPTYDNGEVEFDGGGVNYVSRFKEAQYSTDEMEPDTNEYHPRDQQNPQDRKGSHSSREMAVRNIPVEVKYKSDVSTSQSAPGTLERGAKRTISKDSLSPTSSPRSPVYEYKPHSFLASGDLGNTPKGKFNFDSTDDSMDRYSSPSMSQDTSFSLSQDNIVTDGKQRVSSVSKGSSDEIEHGRELIAAAKCGDAETIRHLISVGADVNYKNEFGYTALMIASREGHIDALEALIDGKAYLNQQEKFGKSALHEAAWKGQDHIVHRLVSMGANIDIQDDEGRTALHYSAIWGQERVAEILVMLGADINLRSKSKENAVDLAYAHRHKDIIQIILMSTKDKKNRKKIHNQVRKHKLQNLGSFSSLPTLSRAHSLTMLKSKGKNSPEDKNNQSSRT